MQGKMVKNATWIIVCQAFKAVLGIFINMFSARYLGPANFGVITYAGSLVTFVLPVVTLGLSNIMVKELLDHPKQEGEIIGTSMCLSFLSSLACIIGITIFATVANQGETETVITCLLYGICLIFQAFELVGYWYQARLESKYVSVISFIAYITISIYKIILLILQKNVYWFAISYSLDYCMIAVGSLVLYYRRGGQHLSFSKKRARLLLNQSKYYIIPGLMVSIFAETDRIMIKYMLGSTDTGYYSAAVACAGMTSFVFSAIIDSFRPSIFESKRNNDMVCFESNMKCLYSIIIYLSLLQSLCMCLLARQVILILYGNEYIQSIPALRIVVWYTTFSYLGSIRNIWILANNQQKYLWIVNLSGALANIVLNLLLIPLMGIDGAALASLITQFFTNVVIGYFIIPYRPNNNLLIASINPRILMEIIQKTKENLQNRKN